MKPRDNSKDRADATGAIPLSRRSGSGLDPTPPLVTPRPAPVQERAAPDPLTLRGSFVRVVGPPTVPPPRRSRRSGIGWETAPASERLVSERALTTDADQHEAFALDRPLSSVSDALANTSTAESVVVSRGSWPAVAHGARTGSVMLPPPPGVGDFEPASGPDSAPPPPVPAAALASPAASAPSPPVSQRLAAPRPATLDELPSVNPFAGFEAPRDSWGRRSVFVFTLALALVGLCALVAIAFGFLGKRG